MHPCWAWDFKKILNYSIFLTITVHHTNRVLSLFSFTGVHEPQSSPPAQRLRHHRRWQLGYLRDCFITAREEPDVHSAQLRQASSSSGGQRTQAPPPRPQHQAERSRRRVHALTLNAAITPAFWFLQYDRLEIVHHCMLWFLICALMCMCSTRTARSQRDSLPLLWWNTMLWTRLI